MQLTLTETPKEWYLVHRVDLHNKLKSEATSTSRPGAPVQLHLACKVTDMDLASATVTLEDGRTFTGDLLLGADGLHVSKDDKAYSSKEH